MVYVTADGDLLKRIDEAKDEEEFMDDWIRDAIRLRLDLENDDELLEDI